MIDSSALSPDQVRPLRREYDRDGAYALHAVHAVGDVVRVERFPAVAVAVAAILPTA
jgi:hypothetical protein